MEARAQRALPDLRLAIGNNLRTKNVSHFADQNIQLPPQLQERSMGHLQAVPPSTVQSTAFRVE